MKIIILNRENLIRYYLINFFLVFFALVVLSLFGLVEDQNKAAEVWELGLLIILGVVFGLLVGSRRQLVSKKTCLKLLGEQLIVDSESFKVNEITYFKVFKNKIKSEIKFEIFVKEKTLKAFYVNFGLSNFKKIEGRFEKEIKGVSEKLKEKFIVEEV